MWRAVVSAASRRPACAVRKHFSQLDGCPYRLLGGDRGASQSQIRQKYLALAREHHPDTGSSCDGKMFSRVNAAYAALSDPVRRANLDRDPTEEARTTAAEAVALARAGYVMEAMELLHALSPDAWQPHCVPLGQAASQVLEVCAQKGGGGPHAQARACRLWGSLQAMGAVDSRACNAYFSIELRHGHIKAAMGAYRHAEAAGLEQSLAMRSYVKQAKSYAESLRAGGQK